MKHELECQECGAVVSPGGYPRGCPTCLRNDRTGRLEVVYEYPTETRLSSIADDADSSMWRYRRLLPLLGDDPVTLGEGGTPITPAALPSVSDTVDVVLKNETTNPTGSYKDRLNSLLLSNARTLGETHIATASTGNHGASTAAYAARAGMDETVVLIPPETDDPHRAQLRAYDASVAITGYEDRRPLIERLVERGWYPTVSPTDEYTGLPYSYEAYKTIAFELFEQLGASPAAVVVPVGAGDGLYGIWKGFRELREMGAIETAPRMYGIQPAERPSVVRALEEGRSNVEPTPGPMPITTSTSGPKAGDHALRAIRESDGGAYGIERPDVEAAIRAAGREGVFPEPASALSLAGAEYATADGAIDADETVVCVVTGTGIKWPAKTRSAVGSVPSIDPTIESLESALEIDTTAADTA